LSLEEFSELYCNECKGQEVEECTELALEEVSIFDVDYNNQIDQAEFEGLYNYHYGEDGSNYHRQYLFALYDADNDQILSLAEYSQFSCAVIYTPTEIGDCSVWAGDLFDAYNADQDYLLSIDEFTTLHSAFGPGSKTIYELMAEYDANEDGFFTLEEYTYMICCEIECRESEALAIFTERNIYEDNQISKDEFEYIYVIYCPDATKTIDELYTEYDLN
jgi:Ca2+-binding EF-hand superfamily protein